MPLLSGEAGTPEGEPELRARPGQLQMAQAVAQVLAQGGVLVVEAGTGVGKTYAYLAPALLSGQRVLISTATRNLQDQLFLRDLPGLLKRLGLQRRVVQLKGRGSYLCLHRAAQARREGHFLNPAELRQLAWVERWAVATRSGDLAEIPDLDEGARLIPLITSTQDNCLGRRCGQWAVCHVNEARRQALAAEVVVVNHHLFFADQQVREAGVAGLLPSMQAVIFDEAHRLNDIAVQFLGRQWSTRSLRRFASQVLETGMGEARGFQPWPDLVTLLERSLRELEAVAGRALAGGREGRLPWSEGAPEGVDAPAWSAAVQRLLGGLQRLRQGLECTQDGAPGLRPLVERARLLHDELASFQEDAQPGLLRSLELGRSGLRCLQVPLTMADALAVTMGRDAGAGPQSWVFTSATLGLDEQLGWFMAQSGLQGKAATLRVPSPFDHRQQAALHVPSLPQDAQEPDHGLAVATWAVEPIRRLGGRTLVLATSLRALGQLAEGLQRELAGSGIEVLVQGRGSRRALLSRFRQGAAGDAPCVLIASGAFWEGIDVPGPALQLLIIDKLPFPPPDDPVVQARSRDLNRQGQRPFESFILPETAMSLRQGAGRLIRSMEDRGVLVIADERLVTRSYGQTLLQALPPMPMLEGHEAFMEALVRLQVLTRASTTGPPS